MVEEEKSRLEKRDVLRSIPIGKSPNPHVGALAASAALLKTHKGLAQML